MEAVTTAGMIALCIGLIEVVKLLIEKFFKPKSDEDKSSLFKDELAQLRRNDEKITEVLGDIAQNQRRSLEIMERLENKLEKVSDKIDDDRLERAQAYYHKGNGKAL